MEYLNLGISLFTLICILIVGIIMFNRIKALNEFNSIMKSYFDISNIDEIKRCFELKHESVTELKLNMRGEDIELLHLALAILKYTISEEELESHQFGKSTHQAVKDFQKQHKLEASGIVNQQTANAINISVLEIISELNIPRTKKDKEGSIFDLYRIYCAFNMFKAEKWLMNLDKSLKLYREIQKEIGANLSLELLNLMSYYKSNKELVLEEEALLIWNWVNKVTDCNCKDFTNQQGYIARYDRDELSKTQLKDLIKLICQEERLLRCFQNYFLVKDGQA